MFSRIPGGRIPWQHAQCHIHRAGKRWGQASQLRKVTTEGGPPRQPGGAAGPRVLPASSEQPQRAVVGSPHRLVVQGDAADAAILGQDAGLWLDLLGGEDTPDGGEQRIPVEQIEVAGELLHAVDELPQMWNVLR